MSSKPLLSKENKLTRYTPVPNVKLPVVEDLRTDEEKHNADR